jgi:CheY-like chemotaxis protein
MLIGRPIRILLVEDNPADVRWAQESLREGRLANEMDVARDGEEALAYLRRQGKFAGVKLPDLILLDLNLPKKDGVEVLAEIRSDAELKDMPVAVLTTSRVHKEIIVQRFSLQEDCFLEKPLDFVRFLEAVRCFSHLSLGIVSNTTA